MATDPAPALKDSLNAERIRHIADQTSLICAGFNAAQFLGSAQAIDQLSLMARVRLLAEGFHAALPGDYRANLAVLRELAPRLNGGFSALILPEYVALHGLEDFDSSMEALAFFTQFGTSEFAIRHFLQRDLPRTLAVMEAWAQHENEHVRRLASEGSRPRLPWSFHIKPLMQDPAQLAAILDALNNDPSLYVRRSVANSLNDITKDNPAWALDRIEQWPLDNPGTAWIAKHALRSLIKQGDRRALTVIGAGQEASVTISDLRIAPAAIRLGETIELSFCLTSTAPQAQRLVVDYAVHYVKKSGSSAAKVFKLKTLELAAGASETIRKQQRIANFTTRLHYPGHHAVEIMVNGQTSGRTGFDLLPE